MPTADNAKSWAAEHARGLWCSPLTVFTEDYKLDHEGLAENVEYLIAQMGVDGLGYGHGEPWSLSHEERKETAENFLRSVAGRAVTYVHTHDHSAPDTVDFTNHAATHGADLVMIEPPYEHAKSDEHIYQYYKFVCANTDVGIVLLNTPHSGRLMSIDLLDRLADLPAICALKDGVNDWMTSYLINQAIGDRVVVSHPREEEAISSLIYLKQPVKLGSSALFMLQTPDWQPIRKYTELAEAGRIGEAFEVWAAMGPLRNLWSSIYTGLWGPAPEHPIATTKAWMEAVGMRGGPMRPPLTGMAPDERRSLALKVRAAFEESARDQVLVSHLGPSPDFERLFPSFG